MERQLQDSLSRMFPELLRFSSSSRLLEMVPEDLKSAHRPSVITEAPASVVNESRSHLRIESRERGKGKLAVTQVPSIAADLWDGWGDGADAKEDTGSARERAFNADSEESEDDLDLTEMGL